ncbi:hypothetical protein E5983_04850 [Streptococcus danieliae]|uniref:Lipoprotein n=1 Tax=Streptococcus danieliae TaxID=747656 RepID=A0A7X3KC79_9STRE|nr:hypothetical protein [Streptococcus danieliae]MVX58974.1 hypothetical protein [Streptococcus danieliae]
MKQRFLVLVLASLALVACGQKQEGETKASSSQKQAVSSSKKAGSSKQATSSEKARSSAELVAESAVASSQVEPVSQEMASSSSSQAEASAVPEVTGGAETSVIDGTWSSPKGGSFTVAAGTLTKAESTFTVKQLEENAFTLEEVMASPPVYIYVPAGQVLSTGPKNYESDESRERIFILPQYDAPQEAMEPYIYYRN